LLLDSGRGRNRISVRPLFVVLQSCCLSLLVLLPPSDDPRPLVLRILPLLVQPAEEGALPGREGRHLLEDGLEELVVVVSGDDGEVFARSLLELGVEDMPVAVEDGDELVFDLREQVCPA
jgi:hypothetical protein